MLSPIVFFWCLTMLLTQIKQLSSTFALLFQISIGVLYAEQIMTGVHSKLWMFMKDGHYIIWAFLAFAIALCCNLVNSSHSMWIDIGLFVIDLGLGVLARTVYDTNHRN